MKTKLFSLFLAFIVSGGTISAAIAGNVYIDGLFYKLDASSRTAEVTSLGRNIIVANIPSSFKYEGATYRVTTIGEKAFDSCNSLTSVTIPNSVTSIENYAFYGCTGLTSVTIPNSVKTISKFTFSGCTGLTSVTIPNSVTSIENCAFYGCTGLNSVTIPNSVTDVTPTAFYQCSSLTSIDVANDNPNYCSINGVLYNKDKTTLILYPGGKQGAYTIPNSVTSIGGSAFAGCTALSSVTIPNSVTSITASAFAGCTGLTSIEIPNSVTSIGERAFSKCTRLPLITMPNSVTSIEEYAFSDCIGLTSVTIPSSVKTIRNYVFSGCTGLTSITIPNSVTGIFNSAFIDCTALSSVTIPNSVTSIGNMAFCGCTGLTSVTISNSVTRIGESAFSGCSGLTSVTIGSSITNIGKGAFSGCTDLRTIYFNGTLTQWCSRYYYYTNLINPWTGGDLYIDGQLLTSVKIPNGISAKAFYKCSSLTSIDVENDNPNYCSIDGVLYNKDKTTLILYPGGKQGAYTIPNSVTLIGGYAFYGCRGLTSLAIPNSVTRIGNEAFYYCSGLTSVVIPNSVTSIGEWAFAKCTGLTSVTIGNSVTSIEKGAFAYCYSLTSLTCEVENPPTLGDYAFYDVDKSIPFNVLAGCVEAYRAADQWKDFKNILPIAAKETEVVTPTVVPEVTSAEIAWPTVTGAASYELVIKDASGNVICVLTFNEKGQLTSIAFNAPGRNEAQQPQSAGFAFTVTGLEPSTQYNYSITAKNASGATLHTETGTFTTKALEALDQITNDKCQMTNKLLRNGQVFILKGEKTYTLTGQEVK